MPFLSIAYLPCVQYFGIIAGADAVQIEKYEHFVKQTYRSRCCILGANGMQNLTIPVVKNHGGKTHICDIQIDYSMRWQQQHWRALTAAYNNSPFFAHYAGELRPFYEKQERFLFDFNYGLLQKIIEWLHLSVEVHLTKIYIKNVKYDFRNTISPKNKALPSDIVQQPYYQRFTPKFGFVPNLSIVDLLFNEGSNSASFLHGVNFNAAPSVPS